MFFIRDVHQSCAKNCGPGRLRDFVTVLSLSFHSIFEGLAVGLETSTESVWKLFAGTCVKFSFYNKYPKDVVYDYINYIHVL